MILRDNPYSDHQKVEVGVLGGLFAFIESKFLVPNSYLALELGLGHSISYHSLHISK